MVTAASEEFVTLKTPRSKDFVYEYQKGEH